ncbi:hypothetical protein [Pseudomonas argentinensis]|uniref:hypothetical protein n=1 Tax=Phytopseudomonas argentinensis TaxID=289370 RepID=UPI0008A8A64D|nr:hypothetical protein [Pseudomonas argentinensis]
MSVEDVLVLHRRIRTPDMTTLHCRELELRLDTDGRHLVLSRYTELYCENQSIWGATRDHKVSLVSLLRWMVNQENGAKIALADRRGDGHPSAEPR